MKDPKLILNLLFFFCLVACGDGTSVSPLLIEAEKYMNERPDSALLLLDSIAHPENLSQEQNALWCLLLTQAQDKNIITPTSDSLINVAVDYFEKTDNMERKAQAYYCQGRVLTDMLLFDKAIISYLKAEEMVLQTTDYNLQARIYNHLGDLYDKTSFYEDALSCYQKAYDSYKLANNLLGVAFVLRDIGSSYEYQNQLDSATSYLKKSLEISDENGWNDLSRSLLVCLGNICESQSSYSEAVEYLYKSMSGVEEDNLSYSLYYSLGYLYRQVGLSDSAFYYLNKAMDSSDLYIQCQLNREFSVLFFESKDYETAFEYNERYILLRDSIEHIYQPEKLAEIEARYNYDKLINEKSQLALKKKNAILFFSILILALLFFIFIVFIRYQKIICEKQVIIRDGEIALSKSLSVIEFNKTLLSEKENELKLKMKELEDNVVTIQSLMFEKKQLGESLAQRCKVLNEEIVTLQSEIENKDFLYENKQHELQLKRDELENTEAKIEFIEYEKQQLKSVYSAQADALDKQITILQSDIKAKESVIKNLRNKSRGFLRKYLENNYPQMKKLYDKGDVVVKYSDKEWEVFEELFCSIYPKLIPKLCKNYPKMNKKEQRFCCLLLLGVKTAKISAIMDLEPNTISKYPTNIQEKYFESYGKKSLEDILLSIV